MSRYLDMLKGKKTENSPHVAPPKPPKLGFGGFGGTPTSAFHQKSPGLLATIKRMAAWYGYSDDELAHALDDARQHPDRWRELVKNDRHATDFMDMPEHQLEVRAMLLADASLRYAYTIKHVGDDVYVTLAVRDTAVADFVIPAAQFDSLEFLKFLHFGDADATNN